MRLAAAALFVGAFVHAQAPTTPSPSVPVEPKLSPVPVEVHGDRRITFRVWAPRATTVAISTDFTDSVLTKGAIALANPDHFHWVGGFSGLGGLGADPAFETRFARALRDPDDTNRNLRLVWFAAGEGEARVLARNKEFARLLDARGIRHTFRIMPGWRHQPGLWRQNLDDFAQLLFEQRRSGVMR